jgi:hypothetical protein
MREAKRFVKAWFSKNYDSQGYPEQPGEDHYEAKSMASECMKAAKAAGISEGDLAAELGDMAAYMRAEIARAVAAAAKDH